MTDQLIKDLERFVTCEHSKMFLYNKECPSCAINLAIANIARLMNDNIYLKEQIPAKAEIEKEYLCIESYLEDVNKNINNLVIEGWELDKIFQITSTIPKTCFCIVFRRGF